MKLISYLVCSEKNQTLIQKMAAGGNNFLLLFESLVGTWEGGLVFIGNDNINKLEYF